jgi:hypothetical protein
MIDTPQPLALGEEDPARGCRKIPDFAEQPGRTNFIHRRTEKPDPGDAIAPAVKYGAANAASPGVPDMETMLCRAFKQNGCICFHARVIADK